MSISRKDYVIYGKSIEWQEDIYEKYEKEIHGNYDRKFDLIEDPMGGEFCIAGCILAESDEYAGFDLQSIDGKMENMCFDYINKVKLEFPEGDFSTFVVSVFS